MRERQFSGREGGLSMRLGILGAAHLSQIASIVSTSVALISLMILRSVEPSSPSKKMYTFVMPSPLAS